MTRNGDVSTVLTDGRAGNLRQARALAHALTPGGVDECIAVAHAPWRWLAPRRLPGARHGFGPDIAALLRRPPPLAIGCGRQAALATRLLRSRSCRVVQILDPRIDPRHWDHVVVPEHDPVRGPNVHTILGSLNPVDDAWLAEAREAWPEPGTLPGPRVAVFVGGPVRHAPLDAGWWTRVRAGLEAWRRETGGSLMLACSPRTPDWLVAAARESWPDWPGARWYGPADGTNPYPGMLAWANALVVSPDSVNMVSEAAATRVPVVVPGADACSGRHARFHDAMRAHGRIDDWDGGLPVGPREPVRELQRVAGLLRPLLGLPAGG